MPLLDIFRALRETTRDQREEYQANTKSLNWRIGDVFARTWDLGFTAFGGPPVHFQILHRRFVDGVGGKTKWIDEQTVGLFLRSSLSLVMTLCIWMRESIRSGGRKLSRSP